MLAKTESCFGDLMSLGKRDHSSFEFRVEDKLLSVHVESPRAQAAAIEAVAKPRREGPNSGGQKPLPGETILFNRCFKNKKTTQTSS